MSAVTRRARINAKRDLVVSTALAWDFEARAGLHAKEAFEEHRRAVVELRKELEAPHPGRTVSA